jgi:hypothetical protein
MWRKQEYPEKATDLPLVTHKLNIHVFSTLHVKLDIERFIHESSTTHE